MDWMFMGEDWITFDQAEKNLSKYFEEIGKFICQCHLNSNAINQNEKTWTANIDGAEWNPREVFHIKQNVCNGSITNFML